LYILQDGGIISQYGMTVGPKMTWTMPAVLKNIELRGSTMGSRKEFAELVRFVSDKGLRPLVSRSVKGIDNLAGIDGLFDDMNQGTQLGKLVIEISPEDSKSKL
jgi:D-arabinose 1-dehydrogenase-like Zn-dependent alcohol dehydrogenase